jgi:undecaprenyl pyrophosphate phosphatase UppP
MRTGFSAIAVAYAIIMFGVLIVSAIYIQSEESKYRSEYGVFYDIGKELSGSYGERIDQLWLFIVLGLIVTLIVAFFAIKAFMNYHNAIKAVSITPAQRFDRYCARCGGGLNGNMMFCPKCGEKVQSDNYAAAGSPASGGDGQ